MLMFEGYDAGEVECVRRTEREDVKCMWIFCDYRIVRRIAIITWLYVICHDSADNVLIAEENDAIAGPVL